MTNGNRGGAPAKLRIPRIKPTFHMKTRLSTSLVATLIALAGASVQTQAATTAPTYNMLITTSEGVGAFNSSLSGTSVQTFDDLLGVNRNVTWDGVGTFDQLNVIKANVYGGAPSATSPNGTNYAVEGIGAVKQTTLTLNQSSSYFGLYWSAGDAANDLKFYNNGVLVADFTTSNLMNLLPRSYFGNPITTGPNAGKNAGEPYGFINFFGDANTTWDKIVFTNTTTSGFEADNYTSRVEGWDPTQDGALPGTPVVAVQSNNGTQTVAKVASVTTASDNSLMISVVDVKTGLASILDFAPAAPAAPAPPLGVLAAFGAVIALQGVKLSKRRRSKS
jgi:hypothetical protein